MARSRTNPVLVLFRDISMYVSLFNLVPISLSELHPHFESNLSTPMRPISTALKVLNSISM